jgi:UPF0042 nucleotide-binding protein
VDNLPVDLIPKLAELTRDSPSIRRAALVVDIREGRSLERFPEIYSELRRHLRTRLIFLDADDATLVRRYSETRRPHPLGKELSVLRSLRAERRQLEPIRSLADHVIQTSSMNVHQLRKRVVEMFGSAEESRIRVSVVSFGFRYGVPQESDLVFDVRFLPNPNYIPKFKQQTGRHAPVAAYIRRFPQTTEFIDRISSLLLYLMPHYVSEGKSYLTIALGCTGGRHRSVMMAEEIFGQLQRAGYHVDVSHRDIDK